MDFRAAHLPDKYWHRKSILVPKRKIILDDRFKTINDIFHNFTERDNFEIYWVEYKVYGNVRLAGELNYCYIDGKFYHLEKVRSQGFIQNGEGDENIEEVWDYYLEYDDWMNDWLNDRVDITGTINKTGDINLVNEHIVQVAPLIQGTNAYQTYNSHILSQELKRNVKHPENFDDRFEPTWLNPNLFYKFNWGLKLYEHIEPDENKLIIPLLITKGRYLSWEDNLLDELYKFLTGDLNVYDIKKVGTLINFNQFKTKYNITELYSISSPKYTTYEVSQSINQHIKIKQNIDLSNFSNFKLLDNNLIPDDRRGWVPFNDLLAPYIDKYPNLQDKSEIIASGLYFFNKYFGDICCNEKKFKKPRFLQDVKLGELYKNVTIVRHNPDRIYWEHPDTGALDANPWWENYLNNFVFTQRIITKNYIYEPGTSKLYIAFLRKIGKNKLLPGTKYSIGKDDKYPPKTPAFWFNTSRIDELMEWLSWLNNNPDYLDPTFDSYNDNPIRFKSSTLTGNLILLDNSNFKFIDGTGKDFTIHEGAFLLLPDYKEKKFVLADGVYFDGVQNLNVIDYSNPKRDIDENHTYSLIKELGIIDKTTTNDWKKPRTDDFLNNEAKYYEKYAVIIPLLIKWNVQGYKFAYDSYEYRFMYKFKKYGQIYYDNSDNTYNENLTFQFPLIGCGFDVYSLLKEYTNKENDNYIPPENLYWGFLAESEIKNKNNWVDRPPKDGIKFSYAYYTSEDQIRYSSVNSQNNKNRELIQVTLSFTDLKLHKHEILAKLIIKLWVYYFGFRWDGSHNGGVFISTNNGDIHYTKPFNRSYYCCLIRIQNSNAIGLVGGNSNPVRENGILLYGRGSYTWDPTVEFNAIGWKFVYGGSTDNTRKREHDGYLLSCLANSFSMQQDTSNWLTWGLHQTSHLKPDNFAYLLRLDKPWEGIKYDLPKPPKSDPFENLPRSTNTFINLRNKTFTNNRYLTPKKFSLYANNLSLDVTNEDFDMVEKTLKEWQRLEVPRFIANLFNPSLSTSKFHNLNSNLSNIDKIINDFDKRFEEEIHNVRIVLENTPILIDLIGTEFIAILKFTINNDFQFELISKTNEVFEKSTTEHHQFLLTNQETTTFNNTVKRVNSNYELSVYGQRFPLKTRPLLNSDHIDIGFKITPINDPKQSETSLWYMIDIQAQQDVQRIRIEVPKELTAMHNQSPYEREDILRKMVYHSYERYIESNQFNLDKEKYRTEIGFKGSRMDIERNKEITSQTIQMGQTMISGAHALAMTAGGIGPSSWTAWGATIAGTALAVSGHAANIAYSKQLYNLNREEHAMVSNHGMKSLENRGLLMAAKHQDAQASERLALLNMQHNISFPANSDALMYKEENKQFNLTDIHLIRYYPEGDQLRFLVNYYKEYGFNVIVPNIRCLGASWIHDHIQYVKITSNVYENETIRRMIEERALTGITMVDNDDYHADQIRNRDNLGELNEDAKQLYTNQEN